MVLVVVIGEISPFDFDSAGVLLSLIGAPWAGASIQCCIDSHLTFAIVGNMLSCHDRYLLSVLH
jgi:hypothetical protein